MITFLNVINVFSVTPAIKFLEVNGKLENFSITWWKPLGFPEHKLQIMLLANWVLKTPLTD